MAVCARPACFLWQSGIEKKKYIHHRGQVLEFAKKKRCTSSNRPKTVGSNKQTSQYS